MNREQKLKGIDPLVMFEQVWTNKKKLLLIICIGAVVGLIVSWSIPTAYTTTIKIVPDQSTIDNSNFISFKCFKFVKIEKVFSLLIYS